METRRDKRHHGLAGPVVQRRDLRGQHFNNVHRLAVIRQHRHNPDADHGYGSEPKLHDQFVEPGAVHHDDEDHKRHVSGRDFLIGGTSDFVTGIVDGFIGDTTARFIYRTATRFIDVVAGIIARANSLVDSAARFVDGTTAVLFDCAARFIVRSTAILVVSTAASVVNPIAAAVLYDIAPVLDDRARFSA